MQVREHGRLALFEVGESESQEAKEKVPKHHRNEDAKVLSNVHLIHPKIHQLVVSRLNACSSTIGEEIKGQRGVK